MGDIKAGGVGGWGAGVRGVVLNFHNAPDRKIGPQAELLYCGGDAEWRSLFCGAASFEYGDRKAPLFLGMSNRRKLTRFEETDFYLNAVLKGGPVLVESLGTRPGGRLEMGLGFMTKIGEKPVFCDLNIGPHFFYNNQRAGDFLDKLELSPALTFGVSLLFSP